MAKENRLSVSLSVLLSEPLYPIDGNVCTDYYQAETKTPPEKMSIFIERLRDDKIMLMLRSILDKYIEGQGTNDKLGTPILKGIEYVYIVHPMIWTIARPPLCTM